MADNGNGEGVVNIGIQKAHSQAALALLASYEKQPLTSNLFWYNFDKRENYGLRNPKRGSVAR